MKILITGAKGQLAKEFIKTLSGLGKDFVAFSKEELDITDYEKVMEAFEQIKPSIVINCAAYNLVDRAEQHPFEAIKVNTFGVANLIFACKKFKCKLVHYSTDYVFDGTKEGLYTEEDQPRPLNEYGKSKLFGEQFIQEQMEDYLIFRTSWVYGEGKQNFLYKLTEWAREYFKLKGINKFIYPAYQADFNLPAKRPRFSAMSNEKICKDLGIEIKEWKEEMKEFVNNGR